MPATLPRFSRGLKLARLGVFLMLVQLVVAVYVTIRLVSSSSPADVLAATKWLRYTMIANIAATGAMFGGTVLAIPELARLRVDIGGMVIAAVGFLIATLALMWSYYALTSFIDGVLDPQVSLEDLGAATRRLEWLKYVTVTKDLAYGIGLITLLRTVQRSAAASDQLALRDEAGHQSRMLMVMVVGDLFYQLTHGAGGIGILGLVGSLLVAGYWIYCHVKLTRFFSNAAYFINEPHELPIATAVRLADKPDKPVKVKPAPAPKRPSTPVIAPAPTAAPLARPAASDTEPPPADGGPRFLR